MTDLYVDVIDVYIVFGILSGAILLASVVCLLIYCHWHRHHVKKDRRDQSVFMQRTEEPKSKTHHRINLKRIFRLKKRQKVTVDGECTTCEKTALATELDKIDENVAEIDLSSSVIELVLHRPDGTLQRKKYRNENCPDPSDIKYSSLRSSVAPSIALSHRHSLAQSSMRSQRSYQSHPITEYGYIVALKKEQPNTQLHRLNSVELAPARRTDMVPSKNRLRSADYCIIVTDDELQSDASTPQDPIRRHCSAPICRDFTSAPATSTNLSPIYSNSSSGYSSTYERTCSPPAPTPNEIRNLTRRITEIQSQTQQKRFVRYNSLPNYRLCHVSK